MDKDFYASNPNYKPIGFICQDFNNKVNDFQFRFTKSSFSSESDIKNNNNTVLKASKGEENTITISNDEVILKILKLIFQIFIIYILLKRKIQK